MSFYDLVAERVSVRAYKDTPLPDHILRKLLDAARLAPSACNIQPWHFIVVRDPAVRARLFPAERQAWIAHAPVSIVACSRPGQAWVRGLDGKNHADIDLAIAMEHLVLAATAEHLGTCWICSFDPAEVRAALDLPDDLEPVALTPLGFCATQPVPRPRKSLDEIVTWR
jgi:nitroreductase